MSLLPAPEVSCTCKPGYVGDGYSCSGNLLQVLQSTPDFSNFFTVRKQTHKHTLVHSRIRRFDSGRAPALLNSSFSFPQQILNYSRSSQSGKEFVSRLSDLSTKNTLFVPDNSGLLENQACRRNRITHTHTHARTLPRHYLATFRLQVDALYLLSGCLQKYCPVDAD